MRRFATILCILFACWGSAMAEEQDYGGWVYFEEELKSPQVLIVETEAQFREFQKRLPVYRPAKKRPPPPNEDPLRGEDAVNFGSHTLVVVMRSQTISAYPKYLSTEETEETVVLRFRLPEPPAEARPFGWGVYCAVLVAKTDSAILVEFD